MKHIAIYKKLMIIFSFLSVVMLSGCLVNSMENRMSLEDDASQSPAEAVNLTVNCDDTSIQPPESPLYAEIYTEDDWICADCMGASYFLPDKVEELPAITYDATLEFVVSGDAKVSCVSVFDSDFERIHHRIEEEEFFALCENLDAGTYYVSVMVVYKGRYIESEDKYESFADEYVFMMNVEEDLRTEEVNTDTDIHVTVVPPQFESEEDFLEEISLIKQDKEKEKNAIEGKFLAGMDSYYMPITVPGGYEMHLITVVPDIFHVTYVKKGEEYNADNAYEFGYYSEISGWTMEGAIEQSRLVQSEYSDKIYFHFSKVKNEYRTAHYELDGLVFYVRLPFGAMLDNEEQIKEIEALCCMEKKNIR